MRSLFDIIEYVAVAWPVVTGIYNTLMYFKTPEEWVAFADKNPRTANFTRMVRAWGFHPAKGLRAFGDFLNQRNPKKKP